MTTQNFSAGSKCPECGKMAEFNPPTTIDKKRRVLIVNYKCPAGHSFNEEHALK